MNDFYELVENYVQSCWNKQDFVDILKQVPFFLKKDADHKILSTCKKINGTIKLCKKMVGLFIRFVANVAQSCKNQ